MGGGRRGAAAAHGLALLVAFLTGAGPGAEAARPRRTEVDGVVAARSCAWEPERGGGAGGTAVLSGLELSEAFAVSPKRSAWSAPLEALARAFVKNKLRRRKNVALVAWANDGGGAFYVVGTLIASEVPAGGDILRLVLDREGGQVAAERRPAGMAAGGVFSGQGCSLLLDPAGGVAECRTDLESDVDDCKWGMRG